MHILHALFTHALGGLEQSYLDYTDALIASGHRVTALVDPQAPYIHSLKQRRVDIITVRCFGYYDVFATSAIRHYIRELKPTMLIGHNSRAMTMLRKARGRQRDLPLVGVSHSNKTKRAVGMDAVFVLTDAMKKHFLSAGYRDDQLHVIPNMIRVERDQMHHDRQPHEVPVIGAMGRFTPEKGFDVLLDAAYQLTLRRVPFRLVLAGEGPQKEELLAKVDALGLAYYVDFCGWVDDKDAFFDECDLFCLPSLHESFGIVILESWARNVPVIASDADGPSALITSGHNGKLVAVGDDYALADALHQLIDEPDYAAALAERGLRDVAHYDADKVSRIIAGSLIDVVQKQRVAEAA